MRPEPGVGLAPSERVDIGWHTFLMYTRDYAAFCQTVAGRIIHHQPDDDPAPGLFARAARRSRGRWRRCGRLGCR
ncbi:hypothetical protein [Acrocarpospora catenulata]|uniref:hypothetical protein n=1 Tax=Acrocarpospora catenulata TaxID=2836182 RepID=UPI001BDAB94F|nr:hypothetical protein [Acrocarpospora catenulata]